ncbi:MAG TPA: DUF1572 family protein [Pyrinomonadaceae bacterium]|nr:DUF1572 family protein [Pyrinomonadaceae bacterium]
MTTQSLGEHYLEDALHWFRYYKELAERAFAQINDEDFFRTIDDVSNSIAIIVKHMASNMISRWTDFLTTDGEKPERNRDIEFVMLPETTHDEMLAYWEQGWATLFGAIEPLKPDDLLRTITIRGQDHTVVQAINRQMAHYANHVGQIVYLAKHFKASDWQSLSVPKNKSAEFNEQMRVRSPRVSKG